MRVLGMMVWLGISGAAGAGLAEQPVTVQTALSSGSGCCGPITIKGALLQNYLDGLDVDHLWAQHTFVNWETGEPVASTGRHEPKTHCSIFAAAAAERLNIYMMRPPDHRQSELAAAQERYFESSRGRRDGWIAVKTPAEAQTRANLGQFVVLVYGDPNPHKSGHIVIVRPAEKTEAQLEKEGPQTTQAGGHNFSSGTAVYSFMFHPGAWPSRVEMFAHEVEYEKPRALVGAHDVEQDLEEAK